MAGFATFGAVLGGEMLLRGVLLKLQGQTVEAEVTRSAKVRRGRRSANSPYVLEYRFRPPGADEWHTHTGLLTHAPARVGVSRPVWEAARESGRVRVEYVSRFPSINRPADHTPLHGLLCPAMMASFLILFAGAMWVIFFDEFRKYRRPPKHPPPEPPYNPPIQRADTAGAGAVRSKTRRRRGGR